MCGEAQATKGSEAHYPLLCDGLAGLSWLGAVFVEHTDV